MDARERLRRYLEQRRELGESELVLDKMSVDDVLSLVSARGTLKRRPKGEPVPPDERPAALPPSPADVEVEVEPSRSALPTAFQPQPADVDEADDAEADDGDAETPVDDAGAPADHPRLRGDGAPGVQETREPAAAPPGAPPPEERGGRARDLVLEGADTGDWRRTLRGAGGAGGAPTSGPTTPGPTTPGAPTPDDPEEARPVPARRPATAASAPSAPIAAGTGTPFPGLDGVTVGVVYDGDGGPLFDDPIAGLPSLDAIAETVRQCTRCPLYKTATHGVPGEGNPAADLVVVGEAPGADEDASGRPFVGASGQLLTKILAAINLAREDVFICNVVKHRPPGNRNPAPDEVAACSPYLVRQLELVRPKVILTVGNFAAQTLLNTKLGIGKLRGQVHLYRGVPLVATYHPAALLRNPTWKRPTWEDVQLARRLLDRAAPPG